MQLNRNRKPNPELFTGTMADVSFLLVIFFVVTAVFSATRGLDFSPDPDEKLLSVEPLHSIDVHVLSNGKLEVDGRALGLHKLLEYVGGKLIEKPEKPVILRAEPTTTYGSMIRVLDELRSAPDRAGFEIENLAIPTFRDMDRDWVRAGLNEPR